MLEYAHLEFYAWHQAAKSSHQGAACLEAATDCQAPATHFFMARINFNIYPCNGYFFVDSDKVRFTAGDFAGLLQKVVEYRSRRGQDVSLKAVAELRVVITEFLCKANPGLCGEAFPDEAPKLVSGDASLDARVSGYLSFMFRKAGQGGLSYVCEEEARARASICAKCPKQADMGRTCATCGGQFDTISGILQKGRDWGQKGLKACSALGVDTRVSVLLERRPMAYPFLPENCWNR